MVTTCKATTSVFTLIIYDQTINLAGSEKFDEQKMVTLDNITIE